MSTEPSNSASSTAVRAEVQSAQPAVKKSTLRLTPEGVAILRDVFYTQKITRPSRALKEELCRKVKAVPGCEWYSLDSLKNWLNAQRKLERERRDSTPADDLANTSTGARSPEASRLTITIPKSIPRSEHEPAPPATPASSSISTGKRRQVPAGKAKRTLNHYPSIRHSLVEQLSLMCSETPNPSQQLIAVWAQLLKATPEDVGAWVKAQQARLASGQSDLGVGKATGAQSTGMESSISTASSSMMSLEPNIDALLNSAVPLRPPQVEAMTFRDGANVHDWNSSLTAGALSLSLVKNPYNALITGHTAASAPPAPSLPRVSAPSPAEQLLMAIHQGAKPSNVQPPESAEQFNELFAPWEDMMQDLIKDVEMGKLEDWNFAPSTIVRDTLPVQ